MKPYESYESRLKMAEMHDDVLERLDKAIKDERNIDACWIAYACFESRINRAIEKIALGCPKAARQRRGSPVGITTKIECLVRLTRVGYPLLSDVDVNWLTTIKGWCQERNHLTHELVTLKNYEEADKQFKSLALRSRRLVQRSYEMGSLVRERFYVTDSIPLFSEAAASKCHCAKRCCMQSLFEEERSPIC